MKVIKRDGSMQQVSFDKIVTRIERLSKNFKHIIPEFIAQKVIAVMGNNMKTSDIDQLSAEVASSLTTKHYEYNELAARIIVSNLHKKTTENFSDVIKVLYEKQLIADDVYDIICKNRLAFDRAIDYRHDYEYTYFGLKTLMRSYLLKVDGEVFERPQHMLMRVSIGIHKEDIESALDTYHRMSNREFTHATPTLFNSGTRRPQLSSCFLLAMNDDSITGIYKTLADCAQISKHAGGIGIHVHNIRSSGSEIVGTNGISNGLVPMLRVYNATARYVDQGGGKRKGSFAIYLEPSHPDVFEFLELRKTIGKDEHRAKDLFYAMWIPDLFMKRVEENGKWSLMCPNTCKGLSDCYGKEYEALYTKYEREGKVVKTINAQDLWQAIITSQIEEGMPYMLYKDACNEKSNQKNLGTIKSSNLCVAPETLVLTKNGQIPIETLKDQSIEVWNGKEWSNTTVRKTGENQVLWKVKFSNGATLECTEYHKFYIQSKNPTKYNVVSRTHELKVGMEIMKFNLPTTQNDAAQFIKIVSVEKTDRLSDTYCFDEPNEHKGVFNGILTGNCVEIMQYSSPTETAVCNLASISLKSCIIDGVFDYNKLFDITSQITINLDRVIDVNFYTSVEAETSNKRHRPMGIGVQGLADLFILLRLPFTSDKARALNISIFETIYFAACTTSCELAKKLGKYESYEGSPASKGILQPDMWNVTPSDRWNWHKLRENIKIFGMRNSLLVALMPTASSAQILGNYECFEPLHSNVYVRRTLAGEFNIINKYLVDDLDKRGLWNTNLKNKIIKNKGSIQSIEEIPFLLRELYKTVWDIKQRHIIDMAADRAPYVDQSQSMNIHMAKPTAAKLNGCHFHAWKKKLKSGMYYLRTKPDETGDSPTIKQTKVEYTQIPREGLSCSIGDDSCDSCGA